MELKQFLLDQLTDNQFFQGAGLTAILYGIWGSIRGLWPKLWFLIVRKVTYEVLVDTATPESTLYHAVREWAMSTKPSKRVRWYKDSDGKLIKEETENWSWIWLRGRPLKVVMEREMLEQAQYLDNRYENRYRLVYWFGKAALDKLLQEIHDQYEARQKEEEGVTLWNVAPQSYNGFRKKVVKDVKPFAELFFSGKNELIADITRYLGRRVTYRAHGIRCKRGYLLSGPPGGGKTSTIIAVAKMTGRAIYMLPLSDVKTDSDLIELMSEIPAESILAFEDVDCLYVERAGSTLSYSTFLNCIDGMHSPDDCLIFMTTNHKDRLEDALLRRGRLDFHLEMQFPTEKEIKEFLHNFYKESPDFEMKSIPMTDVQDMVLRAETLAEWHRLYTEEFEKS